MKSEDRIIAFLDILGFKALIECAEKANDYTKLSNLITKSNKIFSMLNAREDFQFTQFSDSFVLSCEIDRMEHSMLFIMDLRDLIDLFLSENILLRGGVTIGKVIHSKKLLMGPAMNRAYELESKFAKYPRVIIDMDLFDYWETCLYEYNVENMFTVFKDDDGLYFIDYINKGYLLPKFSLILNKSNELLNSNIEGLVEKGTWLSEKLKKSKNFIQD